MDKKKRRRSMRLLTQTSEKEDVNDEHDEVVSKFEETYGSIWKDFSPGYVPSRRKSTIGRRSGIFSSLPLLQQDIETTDYSQTITSPELTRGPDNSLHVKVNISATTPDLSLLGKDDSAGTLNTSIMNVETSGTSDVRTPGHSMDQSDMEFNSPDYPEGMFIGQNNVCQSPMNLIPEKSPNRTAENSPKLTPEKSPKLTPENTPKMTPNKTPNKETDPYSPSQPIFSTPSTELQDLPYSPTQPVYEDKETVVSKTVIIKPCHSELNIDLESVYKQAQHGESEQFSVHKQSCKKLKDKPNLENSVERVDREKKETSRFFSICKSLATKIVNVVRKTPDTEHKQCVNLENTMDEYLPTLDNSPNVIDESLNVNCEPTSDNPAIDNSLKVNCETKLLFHHESDIEEKETICDNLTANTETGETTNNDIETINKESEAMSNKNKENTESVDLTKEQKDEEIQGSNESILNSYHLTDVDEKSLKLKTEDVVKSNETLFDLKCLESGGNVKSRKLDSLQNTEEVKLDMEIGISSTEGNQNANQKSSTIKLDVHKEIVNQMSSTESNSEITSLISSTGANSETSNQMSSSGANSETSNQMSSSGANSETSHQMSSSGANSETSDQMSSSGANSETSNQMSSTGANSEISNQMSSTGANSETSNQMSSTGANSETSNQMSSTGANSETSNQMSSSEGNMGTIIDVYSKTMNDKGDVDNTTSSKILSLQTNTDFKPVNSNITDVKPLKDISSRKRGRPRRKSADPKTLLDLRSHMELNAEEQIDEKKLSNIQEEQPKTKRGRQSRRKSAGPVLISQVGEEFSETVRNETNILMNHINSADFDQIQDFLIMDEEKTRPKKGRRKSADSLTLGDVSDLLKDVDSGIQARRTTRLRRRSIEIYQAGEPANSHSESFSSNSADENNSPNVQENSSDVKIKPVRKRKVKEENIEDIYTNKNFKRPDDRIWETIYESPDLSKNPDQLISKKRFKRSIAFETVLPAKIKKRTKKAADMGWDSKKRKKMKLSDEIVIDKLSELDNMLKC